MRVSAAVCTYNRRDVLSRCLDSLVDQDYDDLEVIVVDDGSHDGTAGLVEEYHKSVAAKVNLRVIRHPVNRGLAAARNTAVRNASGQIIAFTDDDCEVSRAWVCNIAKAFAEHPAAAAVGGPVINGCEDSIIASIGQEIVTHKLHSRLVDGHHTRFLVGNNQAYRKAAIEAVGYFAEEMRYGAEEAEIQERLLGNGYRLLFSPEITVTHFQRNSLRSFLRQYYTYGKNALVRYEIRRGSKVAAMDDRSRFGQVLGAIRRPYEVGKWLKSPREKLLSYPLIYLGTLARAAGFLAARLGRR